MRNDRGFALLAVMLVLALLGVVVTEFAVSMRLEASMVRSYRDGVVATHLAEAAVQQAIREILGPGDVQAPDLDGTLVFFRAQAGSAFPVRLPKLPRERVALGAGEFSYRITDEESRINLNTAAPDAWTGLDGIGGGQARDIVPTAQTGRTPTISIGSWAEAGTTSKPVPCGHETALQDVSCSDPRRDTGDYRRRGRTTGAGRRRRCRGADGEHDSANPAQARGSPAPRLATSRRSGLAAL